MSTDNFIHAGTLLIALLTFWFAQKRQEKRQGEDVAMFRARTDERLQKLEAQMGGLDKAFVAALDRWELGFRDRLNGQYARSMVAGVEGQIAQFAIRFDQFREDYKSVVRHEAASAIQSRIEDLEAILWQKAKLVP